MSSSEKTKQKRKKPPTHLEVHRKGECGCGILLNPNFCAYQPFLDGWDFTPDVGFGQKRGEVFTPRFIVDKMLILSGMFPKETVYEYDYYADPRTLKKRIGERVFEPAVGTGNFTATILWHKLEYANILAFHTNGANGAVDKPLKSDMENKEGGEKILKPPRRHTPMQLRKYQTYTLVALSSIYFNDIDVGNLQTTKWRILRDSEINSEQNIQFWLEQIKLNLDDTLEEEKLEKQIRDSITSASENWGSFDEDQGVLDVLYKKHTNKKPPQWLKTLWKHILDSNGQLFNGISLEDETEETIIPGYKNILWTFRRFGYTKVSTTIYERVMPLYRMILESQLKDLENKQFSLKKVEGVDDNMLPIEIEGVTDYSFETPGDEKTYSSLTRKIRNIKTLLYTVSQYGEITSFEAVASDKKKKQNSQRNRYI